MFNVVAAKGAFGLSEFGINGAGRNTAHCIKLSMIDDTRSALMEIRWRIFVSLSPVRTIGGKYHLKRRLPYGNRASERCSEMVDGKIMISQPSLRDASEFILILMFP